MKGQHIISKHNSAPASPPVSSFAHHKFVLIVSSLSEHCMPWLAVSAVVEDRGWRRLRAEASCFQPIRRADVWERLPPGRAPPLSAVYSLPVVVDSGLLSISCLLGTLLLWITASPWIPHRTLAASFSVQTLQPQQCRSSLWTLPPHPIHGR